MIVGFSVAALMSAAFFLLWLRPRRGEAGDAAWVASFSAERYRPMLRLTSPADEELVLRETGSRRLVSQLRAERRRVFRLYLGLLRQDFNRLYASAWHLLLASEIDRPALVQALLLYRVNFLLRLACAEWHLCLHVLGVNSLNAQSLLVGLEKTHRAGLAHLPLASAA